METRGALHGTGGGTWEGGETAGSEPSSGGELKSTSMQEDCHRPAVGKPRSDSLWPAGLMETSCTYHKAEKMPFPLKKNTWLEM